jgi:hypothetical protein
VWRKLSPFSKLRRIAEAVGDLQAEDKVLPLLRIYSKQILQ